MVIQMVINTAKKKKFICHFVVVCATTFVCVVSICSTFAVKMKMFFKFAFSICMRFLKLQLVELSQPP